MGKIEIGDYIRTKKGYLGKYQKSVEGFDEFTDSEGTFMLDIEDIVKHSKNIIDLIEVGDIVDGYAVEDISNKKIVYLETGVGITVDSIKSILTKEQYENNCYRLED